MLTSSRILKVWTTSVVGSGLVCLAVPTLSWAVTIGGQVVPMDQTKNQPTLKIQITGVTRPGIGFGRFDKDTWRITASLPWTTSDADPPPYTEADGWGNFTLPILVDPRRDFGGQTRMDPPLGLLDKEPEANGSTNGSNGNQGETLGTSLRVRLEYKISAGYEGNYGEIDLDPKSYFSDKIFLESKFGIANYVNYIDWWKEGFEAQQAGQTFEQKTGNVVTGWEKYWGDGLIKNSLNTAWAPADGIRNNFNWSDGVRDYWKGSENNAVTNTAPAQGLSPYTWAMEEDASPVAILYFRRAHYE